MKKAAAITAQAVAASPAGYPGSKGGSGVFQKIISQMPPHDCYIELFAGKAAIFRRKRPARRSFLIDTDPKVCHWLRQYLAGQGDTATTVVCDDGLAFLENENICHEPSTLLYCDPPYLDQVRTRLFYDFEMAEPGSHELLLGLVRHTQAMVMLSGYVTPLYLEWINSWRHLQYRCMTRGGPKLESLWCNFPEPRVLHDPRYAGGDYRAREHIKRKQLSWQRRFSKMIAGERQLIAEALAAVDRAALSAALLPTAAALPALASGPGASAGPNGGRGGRGSKKQPKG